jgi:hypothetical protein
MQTTVWAMKDTIRQRHTLPVSTCTACLGCVGWIHLYEQPTSVSCFVGQVLDELIPGCILNALAKTMVLDHVVDSQVLNRYDSEPIDDFSRLLMSETNSLVLDPLVDSCNSPVPLSPGSCAFGFLVSKSLDSLKLLLFLPEKHWIVDILFIGEGSEGIEPNVYANLGVGDRKCFGFDFARKCHEPFSSAGSGDATGLDRAMHLTMQDDLDIADLGEIESVILDLESRLWITEGVVSSSPTEPRIARFFIRLESPEECPEGKVQAHSYVLQDLAMNVIEAGTLLLEIREGSLLLVQTQLFSPLLVGSLSLLKELVVEPTALVKSPLHQSLLSLGWPESVSERFKHNSIIAQTGTGAEADKASEALISHG